MPRMLCATAICLLVASPVLAGNNAGGSASLSWDEAGQVTDLSSLAAPPRSSPDLRFPLYLHLHGASDVRELAIELSWTPNDLFGPCYYLVPDSSLHACGWVANRFPGGSFVGDSTFTTTVVFPPGSSRDCITYWVGGGHCDTVAASFCLGSVLTMDSFGNVDTLAVLNGATILGGTGALACAMSLQAVSPTELLPRSVNILSVTGLGFAPGMTVELRSSSQQVSAEAVDVLSSSAATAIVSVPSGFSGLVDLVAHNEQGGSDVLMGALVVSEDTTGARITAVRGEGVGFVTISQDSLGYNADIGQWDDPDPKTYCYAGYWPLTEPNGKSIFTADIDVRSGGVLSFCYELLR